MNSDDSQFPFSRLQLAQLRALSLSRARQFFADRNILEVETPILSQGISLDAHIDYFEAPFHPAGTPNLETQVAGYLQTSPEPHLKRLLCEDFPDIYQITKAFRNGESGRFHNPEFTMVEWYRRGFGLSAMRHETLELIQYIAGQRPIVELTWEDAWKNILGISPFEISEANLRKHPSLLKFGVSTKDLPNLVDVWDFVMAHIIEPRFDPNVFTSIQYFPLAQAAQSLPHPEHPHLALRFEVYSGGMELANGYEELISSAQYQERFEIELKKRAALGKPMPPIDERLMSSLRSGLPKCSGIALGFDRLVQLKVGASTLADCLLFPWGRH